MAKKCIPGVICVENMTLFILFVLVISVAYLYYVYLVKPQQVIISRQEPAPFMSPTILLSSQPVLTTGSIGGVSSRLDDMYSPPLKVDTAIPPVNLVPQVGMPRTYMPVNVKTRGLELDYKQVGILTKNEKTGGNPTILPLMGRNLWNGRDKWQYYTIMNSGGASINAKLPISVKGKSCTSEYGCDSISNGDVVYVEGYNDTFRATIYENASLNYIPF
jgi:hypothetical protein